MLRIKSASLKTEADARRRGGLAIWIGMEDWGIVTGDWGLGTGDWELGTGD